MDKRAVIIGTLLGVGAFALAFGGGAALAAGGSRAVVQTFLTVRRGVREKWRGAGVVPAGLVPTPRFAPGQVAMINDPAEPAGSPTQGKVVTLKERVYYEPVTYAAGAGGELVATPTGGAGSWAYVTDLVLDGQPVLVSEAVLQSK